MRLTLASCALVALLGLVSRPAAAQLSFAGDAPRIYTIEPREHLFKHEISLGLAVLPLNAFYVGMPVNASYTYHFNEMWAWEAINGFYSFDFDTSLQSQLQNLGAQPSLDAEKRLRFMISSNAIFKPMYGKIAVFNSSVVQADTLFTAGAGVVVSNQDVGGALNFGGGFHFWLSHGVGVRFDVRDYLIFTSLVPDNVLMLMLSGSFNFSVRVIDTVQDNNSLGSQPSG